jgi:hypothetical protein
MRVPEIMDPHRDLQACRLQRRQPHACPEPAGRDVPIGSQPPPFPRIVLARSPPLSPVAGVGVPAVVAPAPSQRVPSLRPVPVPPPYSVRLGPPEHVRVHHKPQLPHPRSFLLRCPEQQIDPPQPVLLRVHLQLRRDLHAELEAPELFVLGIVLDQEPPALRVKLREHLHHGAAHGQHPRPEVQIAHPRFGQLTPPKAAFDVGLHQQPPARSGNRRQPTAAGEIPSSPGSSSRVRLGNTWR